MTFLPYSANRNILEYMLINTESVWQPQRASPGWGCSSRRFRSGRSPSCTSRGSCCLPRKICHADTSSSPTNPSAHRRTSLSLSSPSRFRSTLSPSQAAHWGPFGCFWGSAQQGRWSSWSAGDGRTPYGWAVWFRWFRWLVWRLLVSFCVIRWT